MVIRIYRYARQHVDRADELLQEVIEIRKNMDEWASRTNDIYTNALANSDSYVPISFMRGNNETNRYKMKMENKQNKVVLNLSLSLSFCAELVYLMAHAIAKIESVITLNNTEKLRLMKIHLMNFRNRIS